MKALYKWFAYKLPIRSKLLISFSILVMVPILVLGIYSYQQSKETPSARSAARWKAIWHV